MARGKKFYWGIQYNFSHSIFPTKAENDLGRFLEITYFPGNGFFLKKVLINVKSHLKKMALSTRVSDLAETSQKAFFD